MELNNVNPNISSIISNEPYISNKNKELTTTSVDSSQESESSSISLNISNENKRSITSTQLSEFNDNLKTLQEQQTDLKSQKEVLQKMKDLLSQTSFNVDDSNILEKTSQTKNNGLNQTEEITSVKTSQKDVLQDLKDMLSQTSYEYSDSTILQKNMDESENGINDSNTQKSQTSFFNTDVDFTSKDSIDNALSQINESVAQVENNLQKNRQNQDDIQEEAKTVINDEMIKNGNKYLEEQKNIGSNTSEFSKNSINFQQGMLASSQANMPSEMTYRLLT